MPRSKRSGPALQVLQSAQKNLESKISVLHAKDFGRTTLEDARQGVLDTEARMAARGSLRNTRRLMPLFEGLHHYSKAIEVLCNGVPFMPLVWAPIKFIVNVTCENVKAFDKIIGQYARIGEALVRFKTLQNTFSDYPEFQDIIVVFYADILDFNGEAYKFVTKSAWELFFLTSWGRFERRFESIMENLEAHEKLLDKTANALNISEARQQRKALSQEQTEKLAKVAEYEKNKHASRYQEVSTWLKVDDTEQALISDSITQEVAKYPGTHDWITQHSEVRSWLRGSAMSGFLWLQGSPGSGKTAIANRIVAFLQALPDPVVIRHFCDPLTPASTSYDSIVRSLLFQLIRTNEDLVAYIHSLKTTQFLEKTVTPEALEGIIKDISVAVHHNSTHSHAVHIVIDGLDVCDIEKQKRLIWLLERLVAPAVSSSSFYKVLLVSRRTEFLRKRLRGLRKLSLNNEVQHVTGSIEKYARQRFGCMRGQLREMGIDDAQVKILSRQLSVKAEGMFLWARLVLNYISSNLIYHADEIENAIKTLPRELKQFYAEILLQTISNFDRQSTDRLTSMLGFIVHAKRPLKRIELQSAITFSRGNPEQKEVVPSSVFSLCSQLVEERPNSTMVPIHSSVKEYLQSSEALLQVSEQFAVMEHATASMACLLSATSCFMSGEVNESQQQLIVISGLHAFLLYAQENWVDYILAVASTQRTSRFGDILDELMSTLCLRLEMIRQSDPDLRSERHGDNVLFDGHPLECIQHLPELHWAGAAILEARNLSPRAISDRVLASGPEPPLRQVLSRYQHILRDLLLRRNVTGVSLDKLASFHKTHKDFAYTCRLGGCRRQAAGFDTESLRDQHEEAHQLSLRCEASGCQYPSFPSKHALKCHVHDVHAEKRNYRPIRQTNAEVAPAVNPGPAITSSQYNTTPGVRTPSPARSQEEPRRSHVQPSSYWSEIEAECFPSLLRSFGSDFQAMAAHMGSKTAIMARNYYARQRDTHKPEWEQLVSEADAKKSKGEKLPDPPPRPRQVGRKRYDANVRVRTPGRAVPVPGPRLLPAGGQDPRDTSQ